MFRLAQRTAIVLATIIMMSSLGVVVDARFAAGSATQITPNAAIVGIARTFLVRTQAATTGSNIGCYVLTVDPAFTNVSVDRGFAYAVGSPDSIKSPWNVSVAGNEITVSAPTNTTADLLVGNNSTGDYLTMNVTATAPGSTGNSTWDGQTYTTNACNSGAQTENVSVEKQANGNNSYVATVTPTSIPTNSVDQAFTIGITNDLSASLAIGSVHVAIPSGFSNIHNVTISGTPCNNTGDLSTWSANLSVPGVIEAVNGGSNGQNLCRDGSGVTAPGHIDVNFIANTPASVAVLTWPTEAWAGQPDSGTKAIVQGGDPTTAVGDPLLSVTKTHSPATFTKGSTGTYTITVANSGTARTDGSNITVVDTLPGGMTLASYTGSGWTCTGTTTVTCVASGKILEAPPLSPSTSIITLTVNVDASAVSANNNVTVVGGGDSVTHPGVDYTEVIGVPLTITAAPRTKVYGTTLNLGTTAFTTSALTAGGSVTGVTLTSFSGAAGNASASAGLYLGDIIPSAATGAGLSIYDITYVAGDLTITKAPLTVTPVTASISGYSGAVLASGASAYWRVNETGIVTTLADETGNGHDGALDNLSGLTYGAPGAVGGGFTGVTLDGSNAGAAVTDPMTLFAGTPGSIEFWIKPQLVSYGDILGNADGFGLWMGTDLGGGNGDLHVSWEDMNDGGQDHTNTTAMTAGALYHVVLTYDGAGNFTWYLNGTADGSFSVASDGMSIDRLLNYGEGGAGAVADLVDEIAIYGSALAAGDVANHYALRIPTPGSSNVTVPYGSAAPLFGPAYSNGFVNGENEAVLDTTPTCSSTYTQYVSGVLGSPYPASCTTPTDNNYELVSGEGSVTVTKADATCTVIGYDVDYDGSAHTATGACTGVNNETLSGLDLSGTMHTAAGNYAADPWTFPGDDNYNPVSSTVNDKITQKDAHLIIIKIVKNQFGVATPALASTFSGSITGVTVTGGNTWIGSAAGVDKTITSAGIYSVTEGSHPFYEVTYSSGCTGSIALGETKTCTVTNQERIGVIAHTEVTCSAYAAGTSSLINDEFYSETGPVSARKIAQDVAPGQFFYYSKVTVPAGQSLTIQQTVTGGPLFSVTKDQVSIYTTACGSVSTPAGATINNTTGLINLGSTLTGTFIIRVKYDPKSIVGAPSPYPAVPHYSFATKVNGTTAIQNTNGLDLKRKY